MTLPVFTKINNELYQATNKSTIKKITGKIQAIYLNRDWVLFNERGNLIDWDWSLYQLVKRNKLILSEV